MGCVSPYFVYSHFEQEQKHTHKHTHTKQTKEQHPYIPDISKATSPSFSSHFFISSTHIHVLVTKSALFSQMVMHVRCCKLELLVTSNTLIFMHRLFGLFLIYKMGINIK